MNNDSFGKQSKWMNQFDRIVYHRTTIEKCVNWTIVDDVAAAPAVTVFFSAQNSNVPNRFLYIYSIPLTSSSSIRRKETMKRPYCFHGSFVQCLNFTFLLFLFLVLDISSCWKMWRRNREVLHMACVQTSRSCMMLSLVGQSAYIFWFSTKRVRVDKRLSKFVVSSSLFLVKISKNAWNS